MNKIYKLHSELEKYAHFIEKYSNVDNSFIIKYFGWKNINLNTYELVKYELISAGNGKKIINLIYLEQMA